MQIGSNNFSLFSVQEERHVSSQAVVSVKTRENENAVGSWSRFVICCVWWYNLQINETVKNRAMILISNLEVLYERSKSNERKIDHSFETISDQIGQQTEDQTDSEDESGVIISSHHTYTATTRQTNGGNVLFEQDNYNYEFTYCVRLTQY